MSSFFRICSKLILDFENAEKNRGKVFCFWDNSIWIRCFKYFVLTTEDLSWAVNVLENSLKILHITKSNFFELNCIHSDQQIWETCRRSDFKCFWDDCLSKGTLRWYLFDIYLTTFSEVRNFGNTLAMSVIFFWICSKFNLDLENAEKGSEKFFSFWDSSIWIGCVKYSLLITEDLPYSVNALTNSLKILHISKSDLFKLICFHNNQ